MMMETCFTIFLTIFSSFILCFSLSSSTNDTNTSSPFKKIYAFGDSFTDTGNSDSQTILANFSHVSNPPYGRTYFHHPSNRYSDGRLVIDFVAQELSLPFLPPYRKLVNGSTAFGNGGSSSSSSSSSGVALSDIGGVNFAVESTAIEYEFFVKNNLSLDITPISILTQLGWFQEYLESKGCGEVLDDALFWVGEIGVNDYAYTLGSNVTHKTIRELAIKNVHIFLQALIKKGAKYIVVQGQPPTGCLTLAMYMSSPFDRDDLGCVASSNNKTDSHNTALQALLHNLTLKYPETIITYADYFSAYTTVVKNPAKYGFKNVFDACCGSGNPYNYDLFLTCGAPSVGACEDPSQYINWDGIHLTEAMYEVVSDFLLHGQFSRPPFSYLLDNKRRRG